MEKGGRSISQIRKYDERSRDQSEVIVGLVMNKKKKLKHLKGPKNISTQEDSVDTSKAFRPTAEEYTSFQALTEYMLHLVCRLEDSTQ